MVLWEQKAESSKSTEGWIRQGVIGKRILGLRFAEKKIVDIKEKKWVEIERAHLARKSMCKVHRFKSMQRLFHEMKDVVQEVGGQKWD